LFAGHVAADDAAGVKYYRIAYSSNTSFVADVADQNVVEGGLMQLYAKSDDALSQQWEMRKVGDYYQFVNRAAAFALNDPTEGEVTATTNLEAQLNVTAPDSTSDSQLWSLVYQEAKGAYNLINKHTDHTFNLSGGTPENGAKLISWKSEPDGKNKTSAGRLWVVEEVSDEVEPQDTTEVEYQYYHIVSAKSGARVIDVETQNPSTGRGIMLYTNQGNNISQHWRVQRVGDYYMFLSRLGGWAINDPTEGETTATTNTGTQLNLAVADSTQDSQLWQYVEVTSGWGNLINVRTQHTMNINGGSDADGTTIISYKSEPTSGNLTSLNRRWKLEGIVDTAAVVVVDTTRTDSTLHRLSDVPHIYIYTKNEARITSKKNWIEATLYYVDEQDQLTEYTDLDIRARGNSTYSDGNAYKMPFRVRFDDAVQLLGPDRASARNWTLMANAYDKSMMRNALTAELSNFVGLPFAPGAKFVDVSMNGYYIGTYQISDHMEVGEGRVELPEGSGDDMSYFLECDGYADHVVITTGTKGVSVRIHYPKDGLTNSQKTYVKEFMDDFEARLFGNSFKYPSYGYRCMVDSTTLADWYIATEVTGNPDCFWSQYFYKKAGDSKLYFGPMWDYDIAYNNDNRLDDTTQKMVVDFAYELDHNGSWMVRMWQDPWFQQLVSRRYQELVEAGLQEYLIGKIDSLAAVLDSTQQLNYRKYGISTEVLRERNYHDTYAEYVQDLKDFINTRIPYLTQAFAAKTTGAAPWEDPTPTPDFEVNTGAYYHVRTAAVTDNEMLFDASPSNLLRSWRSVTGRESELWVIQPVGDYYQIYNNAWTLALSDAGENAQIKLVDINADDDLQLWSIVPQNYDNQYNIVNKSTGRYAWLRKGSIEKSSGNYIVSYAPEEPAEDNACWIFTTVGEIPTGISSVGIQHESVLYDLSGRKVQHPTRGIYIRDGKKVIR